MEDETRHIEGRAREFGVCSRGVADTVRRESERELFRPREGRRAKRAFEGDVTPPGLGVIV